MMKTKQSVPRLDPKALKKQREDVDLATEEDNKGRDRLHREPGFSHEALAERLKQPTGGATPPAR